MAAFSFTFLNYLSPPLLFMFFFLPPLLLSFFLISSSPFLFLCPNPMFIILFFLDQEEEVKSVHSDENWDWKCCIWGHSRMFLANGVLATWRWINDGPVAGTLTQSTLAKLINSPLKSFVQQSKQYPCSLKCWLTRSANTKSNENRTTFNVIT